jgi:hypothetical protein
MYMYLILAQMTEHFGTNQLFPLCGFFKTAAETVHEIEYLVFHNFFYKFQKFQKFHKISKNF